MTRRRGKGPEMISAYRRNTQDDRSDVPRTAKPQVTSGSQGKLIWRAFRRHRIGNVGAVVVLVLVVLSAFAEFFAPYDVAQQFRAYSFAPPSTLHFRSEEGFTPRPFVYEIKRAVDPETYKPVFVEDTSKKFFQTSDWVDTFMSGHPDFPRVRVPDVKFLIFVKSTVKIAQLF